MGPWLCYPTPPPLGAPVCWCFLGRTVAFSRESAVAAFASLGSLAFFEGRFMYTYDGLGRSGVSVYTCDT